MGVGVAVGVGVTPCGEVIAGSEAVPTPVISKTEAVSSGMLRNVTDRVRPVPGLSSIRAIRPLASAPGACAGTVERTVPADMSRRTAHGTLMWRVSGT
ncbi:hypothetical protein NS2_45150 [Nocardia seriolae NBRC 15557]|nr:hypothetical protein NS2_45150 [Nocardia seriolae NBRC 15557]